MSKASRLTRVHGKQQNPRKNTHSDKVSLKNSPKFDSDSEANLLRASGHSTPIRKKDYDISIDDSPELDYRCSPILCTQEANEIAWDWQCSNSNKNTTKDVQNKNSLTDTPKRAKFLQKKRSTHSPLLQDKTKRKQIRTENSDHNIRELAVELKALSEKLKSLKQTTDLNYETKDSNDIKSDAETQLVVELDFEKDDTTYTASLNNNKINIESIHVNAVMKKSSSIEDLFDDSIDDSMVKCSQEVEEKLNIGTQKNSNTDSRLLTKNEKHHSGASTNSLDSTSSKDLSISRNIFGTTNGLNTYRNNSKRYSMSRLDNKIKCKSAQQKQCEQFEIPDDSFDDCLATCIDEDKMFSGSSDCDIFVTLPNPESTNLTNNIASSTTSSSISSLLYNAKSTNCQKFDIASDDKGHLNNSNSYSVGNRPQTLPGVRSDSRKFFKTKSLSDQSFTKTVATSNTSGGSTPWQGRSNVSITESCVNRVNAVAVGHSNRPQDYSGPLTNVNQDPACKFDRSFGNDGNNRFVKYKSTSSLYNSGSQGKDVQPVRCTPEEIERKRLEAKMRLEAKRKFQQNTTNSQLEMPVKRLVKR